MNVDGAVELGHKIQQSMKGSEVDRYIFRNADKAVTLAVHSAVKVKDDVIEIDPSLLFQRLAAIVGRCDCDMATALSYEMCSYPPSLQFQPSCLIYVICE